MRAGDFNRTVTQIREEQTGTSPLNEPIYSEVEKRSFRAALIYKSEDEEFAASQVYEKRLVTFRCRYFSDLLATDSLVCEGRVYQVKSWRQIGLRRGLEIAAEFTS